MTKDTLAVLLGAHEFPNTTFTSTKAFTHSADLFRKYVKESTGLAVFDDYVLDLFDSRLHSAMQLDKLEDFLSKNGNAGKTSTVRRLLLYYVGHGTFPKNEYCLAVRRSKKSGIARSSIRFRDLAELIETHADTLQTYIVIDACFAAKGTVYFMAEASEAVKQEFDSNITNSGVTLFCSSPSKKPSYYLPDESATAFTAALIAGLRRGIENGPKYLSIHDVEKLTWEELKRLKSKTQENGKARKRQKAKLKLGAKPVFEAVRPEVHTPKRMIEDPASEPVFPNRGYSGKVSTYYKPPEVVIDETWKHIRQVALDKYGWSVKGNRVLLNPHSIRPLYAQLSELRDKALATFPGPIEPSEVEQFVKLSKRLLAQIEATEPLSSPFEAASDKK